MSSEQVRKGQIFKQLHQADEIFVMPNAWNSGSAHMMAAEGFKAIGTTSAGIAYGLGVADYEGLLSRSDALEEAKRIADRIDIPVSVDAENGYGHDPETVAETIRLVVKTGAVGANIEDYAVTNQSQLYDFQLAVERIKAARLAADSFDIPFTLTARAECYLIGHPDPFTESVKRANAYREAGADCLFVPGIKDFQTIAAMVKEINGPVNVVMGLVGEPISVRQLADLGVRRVSIGGSLARATFGLIRQAAQEIQQQGSFEYAKQQIPDSELCDFFSIK
jgi:2-methylisocitrate lyase-like PEP mutase family enzyme